VAGTTGTRLWRIHKAAGRPWPELCEDDVIDFMIMEAIALKAAKEDKDAEKSRQVEEFKKDKQGLDHLRQITS
jgi:hypothetical protein